MNPRHLLFPVCALVGGLIWIASQQHSIATLREETRRIDQQAALLHLPQWTDSNSPAPDRQGAASGTIDWKKILSTRTKSDYDNFGSLQEAMTVSRNLFHMSREELIAEIDRIEAMDITPEEKSQLLCLLFEPLAEKDPGEALSRCFAAMSRSGEAWTISEVFKSWATKDPAAAAAWIDAQAAAGTFQQWRLDGKSKMLIRYESSLLSCMIAQAPALAAARLAAMPKEAKLEVYGDMMIHAKSTKAKALVDSMRANLSREEKEATLSQFARNYSGSKLSKVTELIESIDATPSEKMAIVAGAFSPLNSWAQSFESFDSHLEQASAWAASQGVEDTGALTGKLIGESPLPGGYVRKEGLALEQFKKSGDEQVLIAFLGSSAALNQPDKALPLVEKITDESVRESLRAELTEQQNQPSPSRP